MHVGYNKNEYGTKISVHICDTCGSRFTVCPAKGPEQDGWEGCLAPSCASYDPERDVDMMLFWGVAKLVPK